MCTYAHVYRHTDAYKTLKHIHNHTHTQGLLESNTDLAQGFARLRVVVLDEADRLLDDTFAPQLRTILGVLPAKRQTLLFSATMTQNLIKLQKVCTHQQ